MSSPIKAQGTWIQTFTGRAFDLAVPAVEDVSIQDIAHALSLQTRFCGHCEFHYSVAQHCVHVAELVFATDKRLALAALLHDASEAYHADWSSPLKKLLRTIAPLALTVEKHIETVIGYRFNVELNPTPALVKGADLIMLATEKRDLFRGLRAGYRERYDAQAHWFASTGFAPAEPRPEKIFEWTPRQAERYEALR